MRKVLSLSHLPINAKSLLALSSFSASGVQLSKVAVDTRNEVYMQTKKAALHRGNDNSAKTVLVKQLQESIPQNDFIRGSYGACALMCAMFVVLTLGAVFLGW